MNEWAGTSVDRNTGVCGFEFVPHYAAVSTSLLSHMSYSMKRGKGNSMSGWIACSDRVTGD